MILLQYQKWPIITWLGVYSCTVHSTVCEKSWERKNPPSLRQKQGVGLDCEHHYRLASNSVCSASAALLCQIYPLRPEEDWGHFLTFLLLIVLVFSPSSALNGLQSVTFRLFSGYLNYRLFSCKIKCRTTRTWHVTTSLQRQQHKHMAQFKTFLKQIESEIN